MFPKVPKFSNKKVAQIEIHRRIINELSHQLGSTSKVISNSTINFSFLLLDYKYSKKWKDSQKSKFEIPKRFVSKTNGLLSSEQGLKATFELCFLIVFWHPNIG